VLTQVQEGRQSAGRRTGGIMVRMGEEEEEEKEEKEEPLAAAERGVMLGERACL
jgi:hypothetical protein